MAARSTKRLRAGLTLCALVGAALLLVGGGASAEPFPRFLDTADIEQHFRGETVEGVYADGRAWAEVMNPDGTTLYTEGPITAHGRFTIDGPVWCFLYTEPLLSTACFHVWQRSANCYDVYSLNESGVPHAPEHARVGGQGWTARMWRAAAPSTCPAPALS